jgi:hypothetical protein
MPTCPDCGTPLERRFDFKREGYPSLVKWVCPKCYDDAKNEIDRLTSEAADDFSKRFKYVYKDGFYEVVEKEEPSCKEAGTTADGKCIGYQRNVQDDEPSAKCLVCPRNQFYEAEQ